MHREQYFKELFCKPASDVQVLALIHITHANGYNQLAGVLRIHHLSHGGCGQHSTGSTLATLPRIHTAAWTW